MHGWLRQPAKWSNVIRKDFEGYWVHDFNLRVLGEKFRRRATIDFSSAFQGRERLVRMIVRRVATVEGVSRR
jgi:hypothetical protein